jgi:hypothetical protein
VSYKQANALLNDIIMNYLIWREERTVYLGSLLNFVIRTTLSQYQKSSRKWAVLWVFSKHKVCLHRICILYFCFVQQSLWVE